MKIEDDFISGNTRIEIISGDGVPFSYPDEWKPVIGNCSMIVAIPDMHMYMHDDSVDNFKYGAESLISLLRHTRKIKNRLEDDNKLLKVYQLGDMYELGFPGKYGNCTVSEIINSHNDYSLIYNLFEDIMTNKIYGNHDYPNRHYMGFEINYLGGKIYMEHGFAADNWASNPHEELWEIASLGLLVYRDLNRKFNEILDDIKTLPADKAKPWSVKDGSILRKEMISENEYLKENGYIKEYYVKRMINGTNSDDCKITIIGHTHAPYMDTNVEDGKYIFIDSGAWTEGRSDFVVATDEEIAICRYKRNEEV